MPLGLGHWWAFLLALIFYGAIAVGAVLLIRAIFGTPSTLSAQATTLEGIRRTLEDLKQAVERLESKVEDRTKPTPSSEDR